MLKPLFVRLVMLVLASVFMTAGAGAVPMILSHQGRLLDASDVPLTGTYTILYSIHDAPVGGVQLWLEDHVGVVVTDGLFSVELGVTVPLTADILAGSGGGGSGGGALRYLQVQIAGEPAISPQTPLVSSPYAVASGIGEVEERVEEEVKSGTRTCRFRGSPGSEVTPGSLVGVSKSKKVL